MKTLLLCLGWLLAALAGLFAAVMRVIHTLLVMPLLAAARWCSKRGR